MRTYVDIFRHIRIPVYVIACGVQADSYDALDDVVRDTAFRADDIGNSNLEVFEDLSDTLRRNEWFLRLSLMLKKGRGRFFP